MADTGYNIPISLSLALAAQSGGPIQDDTNINFSGFQTSAPVNSSVPTLSPTANSAAAEGGSATTADSQGQPIADSQPATGTNSAYIYIGAALIAVVGGIYLLHKHLK